MPWKHHTLVVHTTQDSYVYMGQNFDSLEGNLEGIVGVAELGIQGPSHLGAQVLQPHFVTLCHVRQHTVHGFGLWWWRSQ